MIRTIREKSLKKERLKLKQAGDSNRSISRKLPVNKKIINRYVYNKKEQ